MVLYFQRPPSVVHLIALDGARQSTVTLQSICGDNDTEGSQLPGLLQRAIMMQR